MMDGAGEYSGEFVLLGKVVKPHGIRGEVKVYPFTEEPEGLKQFTQIYLSGDEGKTYDTFTPERIRIQGKFLIVSLKECVDRTQAEALAGCGIWIRSSELPELEEGEYYLYALQGKTALTEGGITIGQITDVLTGDGQDLLKVQGAEGEYLIPLVDEFIVEHDEEKIIFSLPPGLLDINS